MVKKRPKIFFGWWTVLITAIWSGLGQGFNMFGISVLFKPIAADLGLNRGVASLASGISRAEGGLESPLAGWLSDKYGPRWIMIIGVCIAATGLVLMNFINSLWSYVLVWGVLISLGLNLALTLAPAKFVTDWFVRKRGIAFGTRQVILGIMGVILLPIVSWLVITQGWRMACVIWGGVMFAGVPLIWYFVKQRRPEYYGLLPDGATMEGEIADTSQMIEKGAEYAAEVEEVEFTYRQALKTSSYWILTMGYCGGAIVQGAVTVHLIPFLTDMGIDAAVAGGMMAMMVFFYVPSRLLGAFLCDHLRVNYWRFILVVAFLLQAAGIVVVVLNQSIAMLYVFLALFGLGSGGYIVPRVLMESRYFGRKAWGSIDGTANVFFAPLAFLAPFYAGWVYDTTGSYAIAFIVLAATSVVGAFICCFAKPPKPPVQVNDVSKFM